MRKSVDGFNSVADKEEQEHIKKIAYPFNNSADLEPLMELIGDAQYVLLGEASHGTHEYYTWRTSISKRLISEKNFSFIAVEGDWPDCYKLNRYIKNYPGSGIDARSVLTEFNRWPTWMWANWEVVALAEWMHKHNKDLPANKKAGFFGLDVYSLWESMEFLMNYLEKKDPATFKTVLKAIGCFEPYGYNEGSEYARNHFYYGVSCEDEVVNLLKEIRMKMPQYNTDHEAVFSAEQNALIAVNAERYYRAMIKGNAESWNVRDHHMMDTLNRLVDFHGSQSKVIIWEHNTHIGDARATEMRRHGMENVGQLTIDQHFEKGVIRIGFGSYSGSVVAGEEWGAKMKKMRVPEAPQGSWESLLHESGAVNKIILSKDLMKNDLFEQPIPHRAIGVVYHPEREFPGNYVPSLIPQRYEAFVYIDHTKALHPLHIQPDGDQIPETFPFGE